MFSLQENGLPPIFYDNQRTPATATPASLTPAPSLRASPAGLARAPVDSQPAGDSDDSPETQPRSGEDLLQHEEIEAATAVAQVTSAYMIFTAI